MNIVSHDYLYSFLLGKTIIQGISLCYVLFLVKNVLSNNGMCISFFTHNLMEVKISCIVECQKCTGHTKPQLIRLAVRSEQCIQCGYTLRNLSQLDI